MISELQAFRQKYPDYNDLDDSTLAQNLADRFPEAYGDLPGKVAAESPSGRAPSNNLTTKAERTAAFGGIYQGNPTWKERVHQFANEFLPGIGAGAGAVVGGGAAVPTGPGATIAGAAGAGAGYATGKKLAQGVDALIGYRTPPPVTPKTGTQRALETTKDILVGANLELGGVTVGKGLETAATKAAAYLSKTGPRGVDEPAIRKAVDYGMRKGVRPTVVGKRTWNQRERASGRATEAVKAIVENKPNLSFPTQDGDVVAGRLPQTLDEFAQAIEQTKRNVFSQFDEMTKQAGGAGVRQDLNPAAARLEAMANDEVLKNHAPGAAKYAAARAKVLRAQGNYSPAESQEAVKVINGRLDPFYKNPNPNMAARAYVDAVEAAELRQGLDATIASVKNDGYQALKNRYGALSSIEKEVSHRGVVAGRAAPVSLQKFMENVTAASELAHAVATKSPTGLIMAGVTKGAGALQRRLNDPDRIIAKMFSEIDGLVEKGKTPNLAGRLATKFAEEKAARRAAQQAEAPAVDAEDVGPDPYATPAFMKKAVPGARSAEDAAQTFEAYPPQAPAAEVAPIFEPRPYEPPPLEVHPLPTWEGSARRSAEVFDAYPPAAPAAERATAFEGPNEMIRRSPAAQSAAVFEEAMQRSTPQEREALLRYLSDQDVAQGHTPMAEFPELPPALPSPGERLALPPGGPNWRIPERWRLPSGTQDFSLVGKPFEPPNPKWSGAQWQMWFRKTPGAMEFYPKPTEGKKLTRTDYAEAAAKWMEANRAKQTPPVMEGQAQTRTPFQRTGIQDVTPIRR